MSTAGEHLADILPQLSGDCRTDLEATIRALMRLFDGPEGLARQIKLDFDKCEAGSPNRVKIEMAILKLLGDFAPDPEPDEEGLRELERRLKESERNDKSNG